MIPYPPFATILPHFSFSNQIFLKRIICPDLQIAYLKPLGADLIQKSEFFGFRKVLTSMEW